MSRKRSNSQVSGVRFYAYDPNKYRATSYPRRRSTSTYYQRRRAVITPRRSYVPRVYGNPMAVTERKYFDTEYSAAVVLVSTDWTSTIADPATVLNLLCPVTGNDFNNRIGRKIQILSIKLRGTISCNSQTDQTLADQGATVRCILVCDKQTNGTAMTGVQLISSGAGSQAINMFQNPANFGRFKVMKDKRWVMDNPSLSYDGTNIEQAGIATTFEWIWNFKGKPTYVHFNATNGGTFADIVDNSYHVVAATNSTSLVPTLSYKCRVTYIDV